MHKSRENVAEIYNFITFLS